MKHKIQICPAILENKEAEFERQLKLYAGLFKTIDIDVNKEGDTFYGKETINLKHALSSVLKYENNFNIHLMLTDPLAELNQIDKELLVKIQEQGRVTFFVHQESKIAQFRKEFTNIALVIKADSQLKDMNFYENFKEIQLMTIDTGYQGNKFIYEVLDVVEYLREEGYTGKISLDGSVNLESAKTIRNYQVDRVSVGSYFSKAEDVSMNLMKLELALNM